MGGDQVSADMAPAPSTSWQVTGQQEAQEFNAQHQLVSGVRILFTTGLGHSGTVFVPMAQYNPDYVRGVVAQAAALMDQVGSLSSAS